jgi:hypothetical protein
VLAGVAAFGAGPVLMAGAAVVRTLAFVSIGANIAASGSRIADRLEHGSFEWDDDTALDLLSIAGSLTAGASIALQASSKALALPRLAGAMVVTSAGTDVGSGLVIAGSVYQQIQQIQNNDKLNAAQKKSRILEVLRNAAVTGA